MVDTVGLLLGTAVLRPYVFVFFIVYLLLAAADLGRRRAFIFTLFAWVVAFAAEFSSIHVGIPFGLYYGVLIFNLAVTWWIGELGLLGMGIGLHTAACLSPRCLPGVRAALAGTWTTALSERGEARRP